LGTVRFSSTDSTATLPAEYTFIGGDQGIHTFTNSVIFGSAGTWDVTSYDKTTPTIRGMQIGIVVGAGQQPAIIHDASLRGVVGVAYRYNATGMVHAGGVTPMTFSSCGTPTGFS